jgi:hypothetical protein
MRLPPYLNSHPKAHPSGPGERPPLQRARGLACGTPRPRSNPASCAACNRTPHRRGSPSSPELQPLAPCTHIPTAHPTALPASPRFLGARASRLQHSQTTLQPYFVRRLQPDSPPAGEPQLPPTPTACAMPPHPNRSAQPKPAGPRFLGARASRLQHSQTTLQPCLMRRLQPDSPPAGERQLPRTPTACAMHPHPNRSAQPLPASPRFLGARASRLRHFQTTLQPYLMRRLQPDSPPAGEP